MTRRARRPFLVSMAALAASGCSATTFNTSATTIPRDDTVPTTVFQPTGTPEELLEQLSAETAGLSDLLIDGDGQHEALVRIEAVWALIRPTIDEQRPELLGGFDTVMEVVRRSVERRRPADADKAHKNLLVLIAAYER